MDPTTKREQAYPDETALQDFILDYWKANLTQEDFELALSAGFKSLPQPDIQAIERYLEESGKQVTEAELEHLKAFGFEAPDTQLTPLTLIPQEGETNPEVQITSSAPYHLLAATIAAWIVRDADHWIANKLSAARDDIANGGIKDKVIVQRYFELTDQAATRAHLLATSGTQSINAQITKQLQSRVSPGYIWLSQRDNIVREVHEEADGAFIFWDSDGYPDAGIYGESAHAGEAPNCRCTAVPIKVDSNGNPIIPMDLINTRGAKALMRFQNRADRFDLPKPDIRPDGTRIYTSKLIGADDVLTYKHGKETVDIDFLRSDAFKESLIATPIIMQSSGKHDGTLIDVNTDDVAVGTVLDAWFDSPDVFIKFAVNNPDAIDELKTKETWELSHGYTPTLNGSVQVDRVSNHIAIVEKGNASGTQFRVDNIGVEMEEDKELEVLEEEVIVDETPDLQARIEELEAEIAELKAAAFRDAELVSELKAQADELEIESPEGGWLSIEDLEKAIALALGADEEVPRADSALFYKTWIKATKSRSVGKAIKAFNDAPRTDSKKITWEF